MDNKDLIERLKNKDEDALYIFIEEYGKILNTLIQVGLLLKIGVLLLQSIEP